MTKYLSDDYTNLYNLVTHRSERKVGDTFHRSLFVVMMLRCLKKLGYFGAEVKQKSNDPDEPEVFTEDEIYIAKLLCHFLELMQFNSHEVAQVRVYTVYLTHVSQDKIIDTANRDSNYFTSLITVWDGCKKYRRRIQIRVYRSSSLSYFGYV